MSRLRLAIIFGSQARKTAGSNSDIDVAVLADHSLSLEEKSELAIKFAKKLGVSEDQVDLVDLWSASPLLERVISEEGRLIEGKETDFLRFRVLAWKRYQNTAKLRRLRESNLAKQYAK